jgi:FkbM family methyltransferase
MDSVEEALIKENSIKTICHIGSHIGLEAEKYYELGVERVIWVEGNYRVLNRLIKNTSKYNIDNIYVPLAISDRDDEVLDFNITNNEESSSLMQLGSSHKEFYPHIDVVDKIKVITKRFDTFLKGQDEFLWEDVDMLTIDCQGSDLNVLRSFGGLLNSNNLKVIKTEINFGEMYVGNPTEEDIGNYLLNFNFHKKFWFITDDGYWGDNFWLR